jgi:hypothetical protein
MAPWVVRNQLVFDRFIPLTTNTGFVLAGVYNDTSRNDPVFPTQWVPPSFVPTMAGYFLDPRLDEVGLDQLQQRLAIDYIRANPTYVATVALWHTGYLAGVRPDFLALNVTGDQGLGTRSADAAVAGYYAVALLALLALVLGSARGAPRWFWLAPILLLVTTIPLQATARFRSPLDPYLVLLAALGLSALIDRIRRPGPAE